MARKPWLRASALTVVMASSCMSVREEPLQEGRLQPRVGRIPSAVAPGEVSSSGPTAGSQPPPPPGTHAKRKRDEQAQLRSEGKPSTRAGGDLAEGLIDDGKGEDEEQGGEAGGVVTGSVAGVVVGGALGAAVSGPAPAPRALAHSAPTSLAKPNAPGRRSPKLLQPIPAEPRADADSSDEGVATGGNRFAHARANPFTATAEDRLSTFAVDVDTASYSLARRYLQGNRLPPADAVRVEEWVNAFKYAYPGPKDGAFTVALEGAPSPFTEGHTLLRVGLQGRTVSKSERKVAHLVFLVDVSGSMSSEDKLPLAREAIKLAVRNLNENDTVAIVTYAGETRDVLPPTPATELARINAAVDSLQPGGGTNMGSGFELAYRHAVQKASAGSISRVIVLTDGDANLGRNLTADQMLASIQKYVAEGVTLSTIGFGMGNYRDDLMEKLADKGNGNCFYIDSFKEARKVFEERLAGTLQVIAKDVKVQVEFNPATVKAYRLVGYENRDLADRDFRNDKVDAGEIGAGHSVTALYEVLLTQGEGELATVRVRAKEPSGVEAREQAFHLGRDRVHPSLTTASADFRWATAVAGTADILRHNPASESWSLAVAEKLAAGAVEDRGERAEFVELLRRARTLWSLEHRVAGR